MQGKMHRIRSLTPLQSAGNALAMHVHPCGWRSATAADGDIVSSSLKHGFLIGVLWGEDTDSTVLSGKEDRIYVRNDSVA